MIDRQEVSRALAKAIAHKAAGNEALANDWAAYMVKLLGTVGILVESHRSIGKPAK